MSIKTYQNASQALNVIELIGMPAVGKSTVCQTMIAENPSYIDANSLLPHNHFLRQMRKMKSILSCLIKSPVWFFQTFILIRNSKQSSIFNFFKVCADWYLVCDMIRCSLYHPEVVYVFDQGVFQQIWSICFSAEERVQVEKLLNNLPLPSEVILLDESDKVLRLRECKREKRIRLNYSDPKQVRKARTAIKIITDYLENNYTVKD